MNKDTFDYLVIFACHFNGINVMKKKFWLSATSAAVLFAACDTGSSYNDFLQILYPTSVPMLYADQTVDSLVFASTYDWNVSSDAPDWLHIDADSTSGSVPDGYFTLQNIPLRLDVNTTGKTRVGHVNFYANGGSIAMPYTQLHYLGIEYPASENGNDSGNFQKKFSSSQADDSLVFRTYGDGWTLKFKEEKPTWMRLKNEGRDTTGLAGRYRVDFHVEGNTETAKRTAVLELTSRGVTTEIQIEQSGAESAGKNN